MERNTFTAIILSALFLVVWFMFLQPKPQPAKVAPPVREELELNTGNSFTAKIETIAIPKNEAKEIPTIYETNRYKAVFSSMGARITHWFIKEKDGSLIDMSMQENAGALTTFGNLNFQLKSEPGHVIVYEAVLPQNGFVIRKTFDLSDDYLHKLKIETLKTNPAAQDIPIDISWNFGLGTDSKESKENLNVMRMIALSAAKPFKLEKLKAGERTAKDLQWVAIDNRYFLGAVIFENSSPLEKLQVFKSSKHDPFAFALVTPSSKEISMRFYIGPKGYSNLKDLGLGLDEAVDFGIFGILGKTALRAVMVLHKITGNFGWAIIILTVILQLLLFPLSLKSFKASIAMKKLQPHIKALQEKYKSDATRLNAEMMNLYKTHKVNPLGGCLPMLLQLPIFWALFTTLRNAYEIRGAGWILWVKDLSAPDTLMRVSGFPINILPLIMGIGMLFQQKMMSVSTDPMQEKMMYMMPVLFTFMFWNFPSGLVLYWLVNSIVSMSEQYIIMKRDSEAH